MAEMKGAREMDEKERMKTDIRWLIFFTCVYGVFLMFGVLDREAQNVRLDALEDACGIEQVEGAER